MRVDLRVPACAPVPQVVRFVQDCERAGFNAVGIIDSQLLTRDVFVTLGALAQATSRIGLYPAVTNPVTRHSSVLAGAMATVAEMAPGRVDIALGSGYSAVDTVGLPVARRREMRQAVLEIKALLRGEAVQFGSKQSRLAFAKGQPPRVYVAATDPLLIEIAGEVADGVMLQVGYHPAIIRKGMEHVEAGARRAERNIKDLDVIVCVRVDVCDDIEEGIELTRPVCANWVIEKRRGRWLKEAGVDIPDSEIPPEVYQVYPDLMHPEDPVFARKATAFLGKEMLTRISNALGIVGPAQECIRRLR
ncbi:MAG: LLM class flavin-dependent oxidoreductase, partial [Chloroflexi bacterium]|nr:LLM class flavin-dependent oxidoreductase [Chloroflexota bacterium]